MSKPKMFLSLTAHSKKLLTLTALLALLLSVFFTYTGSRAYAHIAPDSKLINAHALAHYTCDATEWHFVINQIENESKAPHHIYVTWNNGEFANLDLKKFSGKVAHYSTKVQLNSSVDYATSYIYPEWNGQFNLSHGPCNTVTPTPTVIQTPVQTLTPTTTVTPTNIITPTIIVTPIITNTPVATATPIVTITNTPVVTQTIAPTPSVCTLTLSESTEFAKTLIAAEKNLPVSQKTIYATITIENGNVKYTYVNKTNCDIEVSSLIYNKNTNTDPSFPQILSHKTTGIVKANSTENHWFSIPQMGGTNLECYYQADAILGNKTKNPLNYFYYSSEGVLLAYYHNLQTGEISCNLPEVTQTPVSTVTPTNTITVTPNPTTTVIITVAPTNTVTPTVTSTPVVTPTEELGIGGVVTQTPTKQGEVLGALTLPDTGITNLWSVSALLALIVGIILIALSRVKKFKV